MPAAPISSPIPAPFWGVVRSQTAKERFAAEQLGLRGYETFLPLVETKRAPAPLFRGYFFARIVEQWRTINKTFGVLCLVRVGDCPARCPDHEIERLKALIDGHGYIRLPEAPPPPPRRKIAIGARVKITGGPLEGRLGLYAGMGSKERERVLLDFLGGRRPVLVGSHLVVPA